MSIVALGRILIVHGWLCIVCILNIVDMEIGYSCVSYEH